MSHSPAVSSHQGSKSRGKGLGVLLEKDEAFCRFFRIAPPPQKEQKEMTQQQNKNGGRGVGDQSSNDSESEQSYSDDDDYDDASSCADSEKAQKNKKKKGENLERSNSNDDPAGQAENQVLDRISLLACQRQGFTAEDLMHAPRDMFAASAGSGNNSPAASPARSATGSMLNLGGDYAQRSQRRTRSNKIQEAVHNSKYHAHAMRRQQFLSIAERERKTIVRVLVDHMLEVRECRQEAEAQGKGRPPVLPRMEHQHQTLHTELMNQRGSDVQSNDEEEGEAIQTLLLRESDNQMHRSRVQAAVKKTSSDGDKEIEKIKNRQVRAITNDLNLENQREEIYSKLEAAEKQWKTNQAEHKAALHRKSLLANRKREYKILRLQERQEQKYQSKKDSLEKRQSEREELEHQISKRKEEEMRVRREKAEEHMQIVKRKVEMVREEEVSKCRLLQHEQDAKQSLHEERRKNLHLRLDTAKELRSMDAGKRHYQITEYKSKSAVNTDEKQKQCDTRVEEANKRKSTSDREQRNKYREIQEEQKMNVQDADERRKEARRKREARHREIIQSEYQKELLIQKMREDDAEKQELSKAMNLQKREQHLHNMERIQRLSSYKQSIKDAKLQEDLAHQAEQQRRQKELACRLQQARQRVAEGKERVINKFLKLRSSPQWSQMNPKEVIERELMLDNNNKKKETQTQFSNNSTPSQQSAHQPRRPQTSGYAKPSADRSECSGRRTTSQQRQLTYSENSNTSSAAGGYRPTTSSASTSSRRSNTPLDEMMDKLRPEE